MNPGYIKLSIKTNWVSYVARVLAFSANQYIYLGGCDSDVCMTPEEFRELCDSIGFDVDYTVDPDEIDGDRAPLNGTNENGDTIYYRKSLDSGEWVLDIDPARYTLDKESFSPDRVDVKGDELVLEDVCGTRPSSGYGNSGFAHAEFRLGSNGAKVVETH